MFCARRSVLLVEVLRDILEQTTDALAHDLGLLRYHNVDGFREIVVSGFDANPAQGDGIYVPHRNPFRRAHAVAQKAPHIEPA